MKKSSKFFKFLTIFSVFTMVLTVGLCPTVAKASESVSAYNGPYSVSLERKWYGEWGYITHVPNDYYGNSMTFSYVDQFDHVETNARLKFVFLNVDFVSSLDNHLETSFKFSAQGTDFESVSPDFFTNVYVYGRVSGYDYFKPLPINYNFIVVGKEVFMTFDYAGIESVVDLNVYVEFNIDTVFGSSPFIDGSGNFILSIPTSGFTLTTNTFSGSVPSVSVPTPDDLEVNFNNLPSLDGYIPSDSNYFIVAIRKFTDNRFVLPMLIISVVMGVIAYALYGKRNS